MIWTSQIKPEYGYVLLAFVIYAFEIIMIGTCLPGRTRYQIFTEQYMKKNFGEEHNRIFNEEIKAGGYPDTGSGFYAKGLPYEDWYKLNNAQRAHLNCIEMVASTMAFLLVAGIIFPIPAAAFGLLVIIGRLFYAVGYATKGMQGRVLGSGLNYLGMLALFVLSVTSCIYFILNEDL